jgi:tartrate dehydrogenase/decarboxylase/D-malate dehydrogenase
MLEWLGYGEQARVVEEAVCHVLSEGEIRTADIGGSSTTSEVGDAIASCVSDGPPVDSPAAKLVEAEG